MRSKLKILIIAFAFLGFFGAGKAFASFSYKASITVNDSYVPSDQTHFPVLVSGTYAGAGGVPDLRTTGNSGHVQNANGYDIYFYSDSALTTRLPAERESYNASTGAVVFWVNTSVTHASNTVIYIAYGNSSVSSDPNLDGTYGATSVWDSNYKAVWHLASPASPTDSTGVNNGTNHGATATAGQADGGANFNGSSYIDAGSNASLQIAGKITVESWMNVPSFPGSAETPLVDQGYNGTTFGWNMELYGYGTNQLRFGVNSTYASYAFSNFSTGNWYHLVGVYDGTNWILYVNGSAVNTTSGGGAINSGRNVEIGAFDNQGTPGQEPLTGTLDEVRVSNTNRSADWIKTEYNNQSSPSTFYTMGSETGVTVIKSSVKIRGGGSLTGFSYEASITIDHTKVPNTDQTNFPILVSGTYDGTGGLPNLKSIGNSGHVQNANGYDIWFYSNSALTARIPAERESYNASTGAVVFWVKKTVLTASNTVIYIAYGNSSVSSDPNLDGTYGATSTWDSNYGGVWHLPNGTSLGVSDSTGVNNGTNHGATATTGQVDGGANFNGSSYISTSLNPSGYTVETMEAWMKRASAGNYVYVSADTGSNGDQLGYYSDGSVYVGIGDGVYGYFANNDTNWHHVVMVYDGSQSTDATKLKLYLDGTQQTLTWLGSGVATAIPTMTNLFNIGVRYGALWYTTGSIDEVRVSNTNRSADWIKTEYNNQSSPSTFYTMGSETGVTVIKSSVKIRGGGSLTGFSYEASITIDHTKVPNTDQTNFPILVSGTYDGTGGLPNLKSIGNSGHVQNANGYDIWFYSNSALTARIPAERESYNASTGAVVFWVKKTVLTASNTVIYIAYGNSSVSSDPNLDGTYGATSTWDSNYKGVWHYPNGTTLTSNDSTSNANNASGSAPAATAGQIDGAASFNGSGNYLLGANTVNTSNATISAWVYVTANPASNALIAGFAQGNGSGTYDKDLYLDSSGKLYFYAYGAGAFVTSTPANPIPLNQWVYVVGTIGANEQIAYVNGSSVGTYSNWASYASYGGADVLAGGSTALFTYLTEKLDEFRVSTIQRSADWIKTEYNNQSSPSTFYAMGSETGAASVVKSSVKIRGGGS